MTILREELITNHLLLDYFDMWDEFDIQKVEDPKTIRYYNLLENHLQNQIDASIKWLESDEARDYFFGEAKYQREVFQALEDEWDSILEGKYPSVEALLSEVYRRGKAKGYSDMQERIRYTDTDKEALKISQDYNYHLIRKIDNDTRNQIKNKITEAVIAGEHPYTVAPKILNVAEERLEGSNFTPRQRATMIARTEISRVQNTGILQSYVNEGYVEVKILTAEDNNVCDTCLRYAFEFNENDDIIFENRGKEKVHNIIKLVKGGKFPPFHPLCRCTYLSVWKSKGKPPENPFIVNLNPVAHGYNNVPENIKPSNMPMLNMSRSELENNLNEIINNSMELKTILNTLDLDFRYNIKDNSFEWGIGVGNEGEYQTTYKGEKDTIDLSSILLKAAKNKGILLFAHNHPVTTSPLASFQDYALVANYKIKYAIVTNEFGTLIIKNKKVEKSLKNAEDVEKISTAIQKGLSKNFQNYIEYLDKTTNQKWLSEEEYDKEFQNFAKEHHNEYLQKYQEELKEYLDITFINA